MKQCIGFPTDDQISIFLRTGRAKGFLLIDIQDGKESGRRFVENPHHHDHENDQDHHDIAEHHHHEVTAILQSCSMVFVRALGKHMKTDFIEAQIPYTMTKEENIDQILKEYLR